MLAEYVKTDNGCPSTGFPKHDPENILRTGALSGLVPSGGGRGNVSYCPIW